MARKFGLRFDGGCSLGPENAVQRVVDTVPFRQELIEYPAAQGRESVKALVSLLLLAPFTGQQALRLQPAKQRVERALLNGQPMVSQSLAQRVAVVLLAKLRQNRKNEAPAAKFESKRIEQFALKRIGLEDGIHTVLHILYDA
ncbi:hypothetical protein EDE15_2578 [Edaphobacter aggregans]|uniref:Uncharacterized protein n=1 Tax=Edaphobacter aggregans TaxID=570835 RepID=A0A428MJK1_9BACT|nr:hypothetical protein EDE15_2578 [Edaphobacter aggregans]